MNISWLYNGMILIQRDGFGPHFNQQAVKNYLPFLRQRIWEANWEDLRKCTGNCVDYSKINFLMQWFDFLIDCRTRPCYVFILDWQRHDGEEKLVGHWWSTSCGWLAGEDEDGNMPSRLVLVLASSSRAIHHVLNAFWDLGGRLWLPGIIT